MVLINAVKEQQTQIEKQQSQIASLRTANATLNSRLRAIEKRLQKRGGSSRAVSLSNNPSLVLMEYFGYLRRDPFSSG
jgi:hypothetical protein